MIAAEQLPMESIDPLQVGQRDFFLGASSPLLQALHAGLGVRVEVDGHVGTPTQAFAEVVKQSRLSCV